MSVGRMRASPDRQGRRQEVKHRLHQFASVEQCLVVMVRTRNDDKSLLGYEGLVQASALLNRDDAVTISRNYERRTCQAFCALERWIAIAKQPSDRQERIVVPADVRHRSKRRPQHERERWRLSRQSKRHGGTE